MSAKIYNLLTAYNCYKEFTLRIHTFSSIRERYGLFLSSWEKRTFPCFSPDRVHSLETSGWFHMSAMSSGEATESQYVYVPPESFLGLGVSNTNTTELKETVLNLRRELASQDFIVQ